MKRDGGLYADAFSHEMCVVIRDRGRSVLFSGCAHSGIVNILRRYREVYGGNPDDVISGFHMKKRGGFTDADIRTILDTAEELKEYRKTTFYTCHCTGNGPYEVMKREMGQRLHRIHCGDELTLAPKNPVSKTKGRKIYMKQHKFFAWATVVCFLMTMLTGYNRK